MSFDCDVLILGGGSAGIVSGMMAASLGLRVTLVEKNAIGGECLFTGCVPSKALLHAAKTARTIRTAGEAGLKAHKVTRANAAGVLQHVRDSIKQVSGADGSEGMLRQAGVDVRFGSPVFQDANTVLVDGAPITARTVILATGSRPSVPSIPGGCSDQFLTNKTIFDLSEIPESLLILGGGPIGVEMAQAFQLLGSAVTIVQRDTRLLPRDDSEVVEVLAKRLRDDGVQVLCRAEAAHIERTDAGFSVTVKEEFGERTLSVQHVMAAAGRVANVNGLNLDAAGVEVKDGQIVLDNRLRTTASNIFACGDLAGEYQFSHMAEYEAKLVVRNIAFPGQSDARWNVVPWTTFTDPEVAHVGLTEDEATEQGAPFRVLRQPFSQNDRAIVDCDATGLVKVLAHSVTGKILGAHIVGPRAGELINEWVLAMTHGLPIQAIGDMIHVYPTLSMANQHAAQRWYEQTAQVPWVQTALHTYSRRIWPRQNWVAAGVGLAAVVGAGYAWLGRRR